MQQRCFSQQSCKPIRGQAGKGDNLWGQKRKKLIRFSFVNNQRADRARGFPCQRDSEAFIELYAALTVDGYRYDDTILNYRDKRNDPSLTIARQLRPEDRIVVPTRPPINESGTARKTIPTSEGWIERRIITACSDYFAVSRRNSIVLSERIQNKVSHLCSMDAELKTEVKVYMRSWATYKHVPRDRPEDRSKSPVYLLNLPNINWGGRPGPGLLVVFGMSAPLSLAWSYILRTRYPHLLRTPRFLMAELTLPKKLNPTIISLEDFCGDWKVNTVFDLEVPLVEDPAVEEQYPAKVPAHTGTHPEGSCEPATAYAARGR